MTDLADFLLARIAEDAEMARTAGGDWWHANEVPPPSMRRKPDELTHWVVDSPAVLVSYEVTSQGKAQHIAHWNPARALAECQAKQWIVEAWVACSDPPTESAKGLGAAVRLLALPYADHPDYRPEWLPGA